MTLNNQQFKKIKIKICHLIYLFVTPNFLVSYQAFSQESYKLNEMEINRTINLEDEDNIDLPTNPFEIVDMLRRANSMNDATSPSDAIDNAIKSFDIIKDEKQL